MNESGDNGAHRCVDYCFCKRTAIISAAKVRTANARIALMLLVPCRENGGLIWPRFSPASSCLTPNKDLLYLIRNKVDY